MQLLPLDCFSPMICQFQLKFQASVNHLSLRCPEQIGFMKKVARYNACELKQVSAD